MWFGDTKMPLGVNVRLKDYLLAPVGCLPAHCCILGYTLAPNRLQIGMIGVTKTDDYPITC